MKAIWKWLAPPSAFSLQAQIKKLEAATADFAKHAGKEVHQINQRLEVLEASARAAAQPTPCTWTQSPDPSTPDTYSATCGAMWTFTDGGPTDNNMNFCPKCGSKVTEGNTP
jgi:hypothetical protein